MLNYGHFLFAPPPRTGSTWFRLAAEVCQIPNAIWGRGFDPIQLHKPFERAFEDRPDQPPSQAYDVRVSLVRHPADWIVSYYSSILSARLGLVSDALAPLMVAENFDAFMELVVDREPGIVGRVFNQYDANARLRTDRLNEDFEAFALARGAPRDQAANARNLPPENLSNYVRGGNEPGPIRWDPRRRQRFLDTEQATLEQFGFC